MEFNLDWLRATDYTEPVNFLTITGIFWVGIFLRYLALAWIYHELVYKKFGDSQPYRRLHQQIKLDQVIVVWQQQVDHDNREDQGNYAQEYGFSQELGDQE